MCRDLIRFLPLVASSSLSEPSSSSSGEIRLSMTVTAMELQARIGGNLFWKFLDVCEEKLLVTAWTLKIIVGDLTFSHGLYSFRTWKSCQNVQTQVEPRAVAKCFHCKFWTFWFSFLWSIKEQTMENWCWFVFYNTIGNFDIHCRSSFLENCTREKAKNKLPTTFTSFSWSVLL